MLTLNSLISAKQISLIVSTVYLLRLSEGTRAVFVSVSSVLFSTNIFIFELLNVTLDSLLMVQNNISRTWVQEQL